MKPQAFFVVSRYLEDYQWIKQYTNDYIIYNKGNHIDEEQVLNVANIGANQMDICTFIVDHYENLPDIMAFLQAYPFDHCNQETFDILINNNFFTPIEDYSHLPVQGLGYRVFNGYEEINTSWYISAHNSTYGLTCKYNSYDHFMHRYFSNYIHVDWIRFTPGSQYIVEKNNVLKYSKNFWRCLIDDLSGSTKPTEGHIIERALWYIFKNNYEESNNLWI